MRAVSSIVLFPLAAAALASCGGNKEDTQDPNLKAGGNILERSITDDMLPYDTLRSQPPLAKPERSTGNGAVAGTDEEGEAEAVAGAEVVAGPAAAENSGGEPALPEE